MHDAMNRFLDDVGAYQSAHECHRFVSAPLRDELLSAHAEAVIESLDLLIAEKYGPEARVVGQGGSVTLLRGLQPLRESWAAARRRAGHR
ncbi:MAG: hypothetical protein ABWX76_00520 [Leifsonia flava]